MRLVIHDNYDTLSMWVAYHIARRIRAFQPTPDKPFVLGLPTGSSPLGAYRHLIAFAVFA